jgi:c-di-GMP-binding flagellar brake protein YcgR
MKVTNAIDLSGGGIKIFTEDTTETNQQVVVSMFIPHEIKVICSVVRVEIDIEDKRYKTSLKFENISERNRDKIIEYIFELVR